MAAVAQIALPFECPEPFLYHDVQRPGFVMLLSQRSDGHKYQTSHRLASLPAAVDAMQGRTDVWISQGVFFKPNRRAVNLWRMPVAFADLDVYKVPRMAALSTEAHVDLLLTACDDRRIPPPSLVVFSGRGLQVKWLLSAPVTNAGLARWAAVQRALNSLLSDFGADGKALDASRVLRLVDTRTSRSHGLIRVIHRTTTTSGGGQLLACGVVGYDFEVLANELLPVARSEIAVNKERRCAARREDAAQMAAREAVRANLHVVTRSAARSGSPLIPSELAWDRLGDLRRLAMLRGSGGGLPPGQRDLFVFLGSCFLAQALLVKNLKLEIVELAAEFSPTWTDGEVMACVSSVLSRAEAAARGEKVTFRGHDADPRYRWTNKALVDILEVTSDEQQKLKTVIGLEESRRRDAARKMEDRHSAGAIPRDEWLAQRADIRSRARELRALGWTFRAIAAKLNTSVGAAAGYCRQ